MARQYVDTYQSVIRAQKRSRFKVIDALTLTGAEISRKMRTRDGYVSRLGGDAYAKRVRRGASNQPSGGTHPQCPISPNTGRPSWKSLVAHFHVSSWCFSIRALIRAFAPSCTGAAAALMHDAERAATRGDMAAAALASAAALMDARISDVLFETFISIPFKVSCIETSLETGASLPKRTPVSLWRRRHFAGDMRVGHSTRRITRGGGQTKASRPDGREACT
jgi:hypothetical protein